MTPILARVFIVLAALAAPATAQSFTHQTFPIGAGGTRLAAGDIDRDGFLDLVAGYDLLGGGTLAAEVLRGDGAGAFTSASSIGGMVIQASLNLVDLEADRDLDLVFADSSTGQLAIALGNDSTTLGAPSTIAVAGGVSSHAAGDVTGDGRPDVVTASSAAAEVKEFAGLGGGALGSPVAFPTSAAPGRVLVLPVNGDGVLDVVVSEIFSISTLLANGAGGLSAPVTTATIALGIAAGDVNLDGHVDLAALPFLSTSVPVFLGNGTGAFAPGPLVPTLNAASIGWLVLDDVTGDGAPDLVSGGGTTALLSLNANSGIGTFLAPVSLATSALNGAGRLADLDHDGKLDVATLYGALSQLGVHRNTTVSPAGIGTFGTGTPGCQGRLGLHGSGTPSLGNASFRITGTNAPPKALGLVLVTDVSDPVGADPFGIGALLHVDLILSAEVYTLDMFSDVTGSAIAPAPIPNNPSLSGKTYKGQTIFVEPFFSTCSVSFFGIVSTRGLTLAIP